MSHTCHLPGCGAGCPPAHLFCKTHWGMVPRDLAREVYRSARVRGPCVDATWAPWWRAQAKATAEVLRKTSPEHEEKIRKKEKSDLDFADKLEKKHDK